MKWSYKNCRYQYPVSVSLIQNSITHNIYIKKYISKFRKFIFYYTNCRLNNLIIRIFSVKSFGHLNLCFHSIIIFQDHKNFNSLSLCQFNHILSVIRTVSNKTAIIILILLTN